MILLPDLSIAWFSNALLRFCETDSKDKDQQKEDKIRKAETHTYTYIYDLQCEQVVSSI